MTMPKLPEISEEEQTPLVKLLLACIDELYNTVALQKEEIQQLKNEIAILKGQKPKPKIPPSKLEGPKSNDKKKIKIPRGTHPRNKKTNKLQVHSKQRIKPESVPAGAIFKGYQKYTVQNITLESHNIVYELERWRLPNGTYVTGKLPSNIQGHYGPQLVAYILHQYYGCRVTEPLLLDQLLEIGVLISAGQLNNILIEQKNSFHEEKDELLKAGIAATDQILTDDTGARHSGKNGYTNVLSNEYFTFVTTTQSKSRVNFLQVLHGTDPQYLINEDAADYVQTLKSSSWLRGYFLLHSSEKVMNKTEWEKFLEKNNVTANNDIRLATEAALFASLISIGVPRDLGVHGDDAGQFNVFVRSLCWIHEERHYRKIIPVNEKMRKDIEAIRDEIWDLYKGLKEYKVAPSENLKVELDEKFEKLFTKKTSSPTLNKRLSKTYAKKEELLRVLERPDTPLHNNSTETDVREFVVKRKVSGGTRSDQGKKCRDTFISLKKTCIKLGITFWSYLQDRVKGVFEIPRLAKVISIRSSLQPEGP